MQTERARRFTGSIATMLALLGCGLLGCGEREEVPFAPNYDGAGRDGGILIGPPGSVGGGDAATPIDAALPDGAVVSTAPTLDGQIGTNEWLGAIEGESDLASADALPFDRLSRVRAIRTASTLYLAIEGSVGPDRFFVLLLDADFGGDRGVVLTPVSLDDLDGSLDRAISNSALSTTIPDFLPDYAWGSRDDVAVTGFDDQTGWRALDNPSDFLGIAGARTVCNAVCETSIPLGDAGIVSPDIIALAVRTTSVEGAISNQTLPGIDDPGVIEMVLAVPAPGDEL